MSDTLQEREDQKVWLECCQGYSHAPWCSAYKEPDTRRSGEMGHRTNHEQSTSLHQPAARGGGDEWRVVVLGRNTYVERDGDSPFVCDMQTYDSSDAEREEARQLAAQIVKDHNEARLRNA